MKILIFGSNGMLGRYVSIYLKASLKDGEITSMTRKDYDIESNDKEHLNKIISNLESDSIIINCAGLIPQRNENSYKKYIIINTFFPLMLSNLCQKYQIKLIHISTDCVFNGLQGNYVETNVLNEEMLSNSIYGTTKLLGENDNTCIIRTSIIGEEVNTKKSLLEWLKNSTSSVNGYINHYWNGVTTLQLAKIIKIIIEKNILWSGVRHVYSPNIVSKFELLKYIKKVYELNIDIIPVEAECKNMSLNSLYSLETFEIPDLMTQLYDLRKFANLQIIN